MDKKPVYLFADSQLLFWQNNGESLLKKLTADLFEKPLSAAYIGASNGDAQEYYEIFVGAMENIGITDCKMISAFFEEDDKAFLKHADIILLAGGDVALGWKTFCAVGIDKAIHARYNEGALLIGVSAGAVQLGLSAITESTDSQNTSIGTETFSTLQIVPHIIGAHEEGTEWHSLQHQITETQGIYKAIGINTGGGAIYHPDQSIEPVRYPLSELVYNIETDAISINLITPDDSNKMEGINLVN